MLEVVKRCFHVFQINRERGKVVILVDSREISGAQDIVSTLRLEHNVHVCTRQLTACDYVLSNRMAVERLSWSSECCFSFFCHFTSLCAAEICNMAFDILNISNSLSSVTLS